MNTVSREPFTADRLKPRTGALPQKGHGARKPFRPQPWSHHKELDGWKGKRVSLYLAGNREIQGPLFETDQFTVKVGSDNADGLPWRIYNKHAIESFALLP